MRSYLSYDNRRGNTYGAGLKDGSDVHTRGWHAGVEVTVRAIKGEPDSFNVYMTSGSSGSGGSRYLGTVTDTADGPAWTPAAGSVDDLATAFMRKLADPDTETSLTADTRAHLATLLETVTAVLASDPRADLDAAVFGPAY